jgi:polyisoprenoid-binding protein YceI
MRILITLALTSGLMLTGAARAAPTIYVLDKNHTFPRFSYSHLGFSTQLSRFDRTSGTVVFDSVAKTGSVDVTIDTASVDTGVPLLNEHLQGKEFFDTARFPTATFKSTKMLFKGDTPVAVPGELTLKGITRPLTLRIESFKCMPHPMLKRPACGADATAQVRRSDFGMGKYAPFVGDEVTLSIAVEAAQK